MSDNISFFNRMRLIDVGEHIEKKAGLSYLSWAYAVDLLFQNDPNANYEFLEPTVYTDGTVMVWCQLTAFGKTIKQYLPVMDNRNKSIANPNAMDMNKAMQRCLAKAIAVGTGLGLYVYRGEDIPVEETTAAIVPKINESQIKQIRKFVKTEKNPNGFIEPNVMKSLLDEFNVEKIADLAKESFDGFIKTIEALKPEESDPVLEPLVEIVELTKPNTAIVADTTSEPTTIDVPITPVVSFISKELVANLRSLKETEGWDVNAIKAVLKKNGVKPIKFDSIEEGNYETVLADLMALKGSKNEVED